VPNRHFLVSFVELLSASGAECSMRFDLQHALASYDVQHPRAMVEQSLDAGFMNLDGWAGDAEIKRLWHGRAVANKEKLSRIFETVIALVEASFGGDTEKLQQQIRGSTRELSKLRSFDTNCFDELLQCWISRMKMCKDRIPLFQALSTMIVASLLRIETLANIALTTHDGVRPHSRSTLTPDLMPEFQAVNSFDGGMFLAMVLDLVVHENPFETPLSPQVRDCSVPDICTLTEGVGRLHSQAPAQIVHCELWAPCVGDVS